MASYDTWMFLQGELEFVDIVVGLAGWLESHWLKGEKLSGVPRAESMALGEVDGR